MEHVQYIENNINYDYFRLSVNEMFKTIRTNKHNITPFSLNYQYCKFIKLKEHKNKYNYKIIHASFDIETTSINEHSYMYIWQFGYILKDIQYVVKGRTWNEFENMMQNISDRLSNKDRIIVWVHNLQGYEFQFMRGRFHQDITKVFAKEKNHPIKFLLYDNIEFRDTLSLCAKSLEKLAEDYCIARKLKGDLDYTILRNSTTKLTEQEERYCDNDVIILSQYSEYVFNNLIINDRIPLTQTGLLREDIKKYLKDNEQFDNVLRKVKYNHPSKILYDLMMNYLFKGGLAQANYTIVNKMLYNLDSYDFTSSYPSIMLQDKYYFPSEFTVDNCIDYHELFFEKAKNLCVCAILKFTNIRAITKHNFISYSKCIECDTPLILNGKIRTAKNITVFETEIDIACYELFYEWDNVEVITAYTSAKITMPDYIRIPLLKAYIDKSKLKKEGKIYATEKSKANSSYGMMVQRLITEDIIYNNITDKFETKHKSNWYNIIRGKFILPQVGIYITAWARYNLLMGIYNYKDTTYFYDTDSIKGCFVDETYINKYNEECVKYNKILSTKYNVPFEYVEDLGCYDKETKNGQYEMFKTLGSKRYIYTQNGELHQTIAGLGKQALYNTCYELVYNKKRDIEVHKKCNDEKVIKMCFEKLHDNMYIKDGEKLKHSTFDFVQDYVNGELMTEYSGVYLAPCEFTLKMNEIYKNYVEQYQESISNLERRNL